MARYDFGGTLADFVITTRRLGGIDVLGLSAATLTFWSAQTGGTKYTDLVLNGSATASISVGTDGQVPKFQGPDGVTEMWVDGGAGRVRIVVPVGGGAASSNADIANYVTATGPTKDALAASIGTVAVPRSLAAPKRSGVTAIAVPRDSTGATGSAARLQLVSSSIGMDVRSVGVDGAVYVVYQGQNIYRSYDGMTTRLAGLTHRPYSVGIVATGGTYTLTVSGNTTTALAWNATAVTVKAALEALTPVGAGNADVYDVTGGTTGAAPFTVVLKGTAASAAITGTSSLTGTTPSLNVAINLILWATRTSTGYVFITSNAGTGIDRADIWHTTDFAGVSPPPSLKLSMKSTTLTGFARPTQVAGVTWLMIGEYTIFTPSKSLKRFLSVDGGLTWTLVKATTVTSSAVNSHNHAGLITARGRLYASEGDGVNAWFGYSDDRGQTWVPVKTDSTDSTVYDLQYMQPTTLIDFTADNRIAAAPDRGPFPPGVWDMDASTHEITRNYDLTVGGPYTTADRQYGHPMFAQAGRVAYVLLPDTGSGNKQSHIVATGDAGATWWFVGTVDWGATGGNLSTGIYGVDLNNNVYMTGLNLPAPYGSGYIKAPALKWDWQVVPGSTGSSGSIAGGNAVTVTDNNDGTATIAG